MTTSVQHPLPATSPLDAAPPAVRAFVAAHKLSEHLATAVRLAEECFPVGSVLSLQVEEDPDCEGKWVVMDWTLPATAEDTVRSYQRFVSEWTAVAPPWVGNVMRVTFHVALWEKKLEAMKGLQKGWNGYDAEPPNTAALTVARRLVAFLVRSGVPPTRVAPSVVGGVGVTRRVGPRRVYVEVYNDGSAHALFAEGERVETAAVPASDEGFQSLVSRARTYLDG